MATTPQAVAERVASLDLSLFDDIPGLASLDRRALLALHAAAADAWGDFAYLEIGSFLGGSLQALVRDSRCVQIMSIDPRLEHTEDVRPGGVHYPGNTTANMLVNLSALPGADVSAIWTAETTTAELHPADLPVPPRLCFIDGEHTEEAVLADARFCRDAVHGAGIIAFHDAALVAEGIRAFIAEAWGDIRFALRFGDQVFAIEIGDAQVLRSPVVRRAVDSRWHDAAWRLGSASPRPIMFSAIWKGVERLDIAAVKVRRWLRR